MKLMKPVSCLALWMVIHASCVHAQATYQGIPAEQPVHFVEGEVVVLEPPAEGGMISGAEGVAVSPETTNAAAGAEAQRLQAILRLQFDRRPQELLRTLARQLDPAVSPTNELECFREDVVAGRWSAVGQFLVGLPEEHRPQVYRHVLNGLPRVTGPEMQGAAPGQTAPGGMHGMVPGLMPMPVLLPDDVLALAELAPGELTEEWLRSLGKLLNRALSKGNAIEPLLERLEVGTGRLGGDDPARRAAAVMLLDAAGRLNDAGRFLPPLEAARAAYDCETLDLHARYHLARSRQRPDTSAIGVAWELTQVLLVATDIPASTNGRCADLRDAALRRSIEMLTLISGRERTNWLEASFQARPAQGMAVLAAAAAPPPDVRNAESRQQRLALQKQAATALLTVVGDELAPWRTPLTVMALNWTQEADLSRQRWWDRPRFNPNTYGYYDAEEQMRMQQMNDPNQAQPIAPAELLRLAPDDRWLALVDPSLAPRVEYLGAQLQLKTDEPIKAMAAVERLAVLRPKAAAELANELLRAWARSRNAGPTQEMMMQTRYGGYGPVYYGPGSPYGMGGQGIALTRARQQRNLRELAVLVARLRRLELPDLQEQAVVDAFTEAHSQAEVFRREDLERVFGPIGSLHVEALAPLLQTMRARLATSWRNLRVQQEANTRRTDKDIEAEVTRGYEVLTGLLMQALEKWPEHWRLQMVRAIALFDFAEFQYGKKVDLPIYVEKREQSFAAFREATARYARELPRTDSSKDTAEVFVNWFHANLGASDLAFVTRQQEPSTNQLARIRDAILALPGEAGPRHLELFAQAINESLNTIRGELKPRYVRAALRITGSIAAAEDIAELARYYDDLLGEIALDVRIDGDARIGHTRPFGVFVSLRHTTDVERESGGFARYLQSQNQPYYAVRYGPQRNAREAFETQLREKLGDTFEIKVITFGDEKVQSRGFGRDGWRQTPIAYLLLQAKDGAVDRLPSFHFDLDFQDRRGQVVLPVESSIVLLDARPERGAPRPVAEVAITQILDDREAALGRLTLDIRATARGLLPDLSDLLEVSVAGFTFVKTNDPGVVISKLDTESDDLAALSERSWVFELRPTGRGAGPAVFRFPAAATPEVELTYKRYADADLVEVAPEVAVAGLRLRPDRIWLWLLLVCGAGSVIAAGAIRRRRTLRTGAATVSAYTMPAPVTPFATLSLLRRIHGDDRLALETVQREELGRTIRTLEQDLFARPMGGGSQADLTVLLEAWLAKASRSAAGNGGGMRQDQE